MTATGFRLIAPPFTPFHEDLSLNLDPVERQAAQLAQTGVQGVFVAGSSGEGMSLTTEERELLTDRWIDVAAPAELDVIVQVGHNCQKDAERLAAHAQRSGADATAASAPCYFKPASIDDLLNYLAPIAAAAGDLPFYYYEIPPFTNVRLPMVELLERGKSRIPNLVGLKYSHNDLLQLQRCLQVNDGEFEVLFGSDETLLAGVALGVHGAIGTTYNFAAPHFHRLIAAVAVGDLAAARGLQAQAAEMIQAALDCGGLAAFKALMKRAGIDCGPVRPPLRNVDDDQVDKLLRRVREAGVEIPGATVPLGPHATTSPIATDAG